MRFFRKRRPLLYPAVLGQWSAHECSACTCNPADPISWCFCLCLYCKTQSILYLHSDSALIFMSGVILHWEKMLFAFLARFLQVYYITNASLLVHPAVCRYVSALSKQAWMKKLAYRLERSFSASWSLKNSKLRQLLLHKYLTFSTPPYVCWLSASKNWVSSLFRSDSLLSIEDKRFSQRENEGVCRCQFLCHFSTTSTHSGATSNKHCFDYNQRG